MGASRSSVKKRRRTRNAGCFHNRCGYQPILSAGACLIALADSCCGFSFRLVFRLCLRLQISRLILLAEFRPAIPLVQVEFGVRSLSKRLMGLLRDGNQAAKQLGFPRSQVVRLTWVG